MKYQFHNKLKNAYLKYRFKKGASQMTMSFLTLASLIVGSLVLNPVKTYSQEAKSSGDENSKIVSLSSPLDSLQARIDFIMNARKSIDIQYFEVDDDSVSLGALSLIKHRSEHVKNLKVRILVDSMHNLMTYSTMAAVLNLNPNVEIKEYNQFNLFHPFQYSNRMHDKAMIIDNKVLLVGGRNVSKSYFNLNNSNTDDLRQNQNFEDNDVLVMGGKAPIEAKDYFEKLWNSSLVRPVVLYEYSKDKIQKDSCLHNVDSLSCETQKTAVLMKIKEKEKGLTGFYQEILAGGNSLSLVYRPYDDAFRVWSDRAATARQVTFLNDPVTEKIKLEDGTEKEREVLKGNYGTAQKIYDYVLKETKNRLIIVTPYFVMTPEHENLFKSLRSRNVQIAVITNSRLTNDVAPPQAGYELLSKEKALALGIHLFEYQGDSKVIHPETLHAKMIFMDEDKIFSGSFNWNFRSEFKDRELGVMAEISMADNAKFLPVIQGKLISILSRSLYQNPNGQISDFKNEFNLEFTSQAPSQLKQIPRSGDGAVKFWSLVIQIFGNSFVKGIGI